MICIDLYLFMFIVGVHGGYLFIYDIMKHCTGK